MGVMKTRCQLRARASTLLTISVNLEDPMSSYVGELPKISVTLLWEKARKKLWWMTNPFGAQLPWEVLARALNYDIWNTWRVRRTILKWETKEAIILCKGIRSTCLDLKLDRLVKIMVFSRMTFWSNRWLREWLPLESKTNLRRSKSEPRNTQENEFWEFSLRQPKNWVRIIPMWYSMETWVLSTTKEMPKEFLWQWLRTLTFNLARWQSKVRTNHLSRSGWGKKERFSMNNRSTTQNQSSREFSILQAITTGSQRRCE